MDKELYELAKSLVDLQKIAVKQTLDYWKPEAENIIVCKSKDIDRIEHTLDALCEVAFDEEVLKVFKSLCRYYYYIDPIATVEHVNFYRKLWDSNDSEE